MIELTDNTILLRPFKLEDAQTHLAGEDDEQVKWLSGGAGTIEGVLNWIKKNQEYWQNNGPIFNFAILDKKGTLCGMIEANTDYQKLEGLIEGDANISYVLYPSARGKGYAIKAINLLLSFLKSVYIKRAVIRIDPENTKSLKVATRCGFKEQGTIKTKEGKRLIIYIKELK